MKQSLLIPVLALCVAAVSCRHKVADSRPVVTIVAEAIAGKRPEVESAVKSFAPRNSEGEIVVFGPASEVPALSEHLDTVDIFDNVDGRPVPDGLPDFSGETISRVFACAHVFEDDAERSAFRTSAVRTALNLMDTLALNELTLERERREPGKLIIFTSAEVEKYARYDLDSLFRAFGTESPLVYASEDMDETVRHCIMELRRRNAFTHRISYPKKKSYVALPDSDGEYMIIDTNERFLQD